MTPQHINILMIDDHPMILEGYAEVLKTMEGPYNTYNFEIERAHSILEAINSLEGTIKKRKLDLVLLDIGLPKENKYMSGLDLGAAIRKEYPASKIIIITSYDHYPLIQKMLDMIRPEGILIKNELCPKRLEAAITDVLHNIPYYTKTVRHYLTHIDTKSIFIDHYDMLLLFHLSEGRKTKEIPLLLSLSISNVERRKRKLKEILNIDPDGSDVQLLIRAREKGYL